MAPRRPNGPIKKTPRPARPLPGPGPFRRPGGPGDATRYAYRTAPPRGPRARRVRRPKRRSAEREPRGGRCGAPAEGPILSRAPLLSRCQQNPEGTRRDYTHFSHLIRFRRGGRAGRKARVVIIPNPAHRPTSAEETPRATATPGEARPHPFTARPLSCVDGVSI